MLGELEYLRELFIDWYMALKTRPIHLDDVSLYAGKVIQITVDSKGKLETFTLTEAPIRQLLDLIWENHKKYGFE